MIADGTREIYDQEGANRFVLAGPGDFSLKRVDANSPGRRVPDFRDGAVRDDREEILANVAQPRFETVVAEQGLAIRGDAEASTLPFMSLQTEDVETMLDALVPVARETLQLRVRGHIYGRAREICVDAMTAGTGGQAAGKGPPLSFVVEPGSILGLDIEERPNRQ